MTGAPVRCAECGDELVDDARFCEACGAATSAADTEPSESADDTDPEPAEVPSCDHCGGEIDADGYCTSCGLRAVEPVEVQTQPDAAYATHRGRRHRRNEDAGALATTAEGWPVLVVADGVSASPNPHLAARAAVEAAAERLAGRPFTGQDDLRAAVTAAHQAACAAPADGDPYWPADGTHPACTIVVAVAADNRVHVANVGDARGYLLDGTGEGWTASQLSSDDSVAAKAVRAGIEPTAALEGPGGHAITAWLGLDAPRLDPHLASLPSRPGEVLLACSDGLWNYAPTEDVLGELATATLPPRGQLAEDLATVSEQLVRWAIDRGGADNICVALAHLGPTTTSDPPEREEES
jgi:serine/threonine protein phosphatase PrpC